MLIFPLKKTQTHILKPSIDYFYRKTEGLRLYPSTTDGLGGFSIGKRYRNPPVVVGSWFRCCFGAMVMLTRDGVFSSSTRERVAVFLSGNPGEHPKTLIKRLGWEDQPTSQKSTAIGFTP